MTTVITGDDAIAMPFTDIELTEAINQLPTPFGQMTAEGFFPAEPLASPYFEIDIINDVISALPVTDGGPATIARHGNSDARIFKVPQIEHMDDVLARDILGWQQLASRSRQPETLANLVNRRLLTFKRKFTLTWELMRITAVKGVVVDGKGKTIIDLFAAFEITKKLVYFDLDNASADLQGACDLVYQLITQDLSDETMTTVEARVSNTFFNKLVQHAKVEKFWLQAQQALQLANLVRGNDGGYRPRQFTFGNITFIEYPAVIPMWGGTSQRLIASGKGHAYPAGTMDTHVTYVSPPEDIRVLDGGAADVNDAIHISTEPLKHGKGVEMLGQMNAVPIWRRPKLLVELDAGSGSSTAPLGG
jgi:hypothetical protein